MSERPPEKPKKADARKTVSKGPVHIIIVEDEKAHADLIRHVLLSSKNHYRLSVAATLEEARAVLATDPPDLMILDWFLPDGKGTDLLPENREEIFFPVIVMTSHGNEALAVEILKAGAADYIVKSETAFRDLPRIAQCAIREWETVKERKVAEKKLRESEERYRGVFENTGTATVIIEEDTTISFANDEFCRLSGCQKEEIEGRKQWTEFVVPEDLNRMLTQHRLRREHPHEAIRHYEFRFVTKANQTRDIYLTIDTIRGTKRSVASLQDITELKATENLLRENEREFHEIVLNLDEAFYSCTMEGVLLEHNPAFNRTLGFDPGQDLRGGYLPDFWQHAHDRQKYLNELVNTGFVRNFLINAKSHDGEKLVVMAHSHVVRDEKGIPVRIDGTFIDITEQKRTEEELQKTVLFLTSMIEQSPVPMWISDSKGTLLKLNKACCDLLNITEDDVVGRYNVLRDNIVEEQGLLPLVKSVFEKGRTAKFEIKYDSSHLKHLALKKTAFVILDVTIFPIKDPEGRITNAVIQHNDITDRKRAEEAMRESEEKFRSMVDASPDMIWEIDRQGNFTYISSRCGLQLGYAPEDLIGKPIFSLIQPESVPAITTKFFEHVQDKSSFTTFEVPANRRNGSPCIIEIRSVPITGDEGQLTGFRGIARDITDRRQAEEAVRDSQKRLGDIFSFLPDAVLAIDNKGRVIAWNKAIEEMTGVAAADMLGKDNYEYSIPFYGVRRPILIDLILTEDTGIEKKYLFVHRDGEKIVSEVFIPEMHEGRGAHLWFIASPLYDAAGKRIGAIETIRDITERKQVEQALQESEERYRSVVEDQTEFICRFTPDGRITFVNDAYCRYFSLDKSQCITKPHSVMLPPEDAWLMKRHLASLTLENPVAIIEHRIIMPSGEIHWQRWSDRAIFDEDGRLVGYQSVGRDTTEKKQAEEALRDSEMRYRSVIENALEGIVVVQDGIVQYTNTRSLEMIELSPEEIGNQQYTRFIHPEDRALVSDRDRRRIHGEIVPRNYDFRIVGKSGQITWVQESAVQISWNDRPATLIFLTDITDRKLMEAEIRSLNRVLEQRVAERTGQLNAMLSEKELLLREIHHRVKNNLQIIVSLFNLQSRYISDQKVLEVIRESQNRVRAMALVHERIYRSENVASVDVKEYLTFLGEQVFHYHGVKPSQIKLCLTMPEIRLDVDTVIPLGLVVNELLSNSLKHAFPDGRKGTVSILCSTSDEDISLSFSDDGVGFPAGLDWKNSPSLGLRLVISLVRQLNGKIELDPSPGTMFRITATRLQPRIK